MSYQQRKKVMKRKMTLYEKFFKRFIDVFGAVFLMVLLSPVFMIIAILVRIKHGKGVIFKQKRVGKNRKIFWFYKFRSMSNARDESGELLPDKDRITKFGKFIRKTSLDELPQLWNILKGDMSFIGPRPKDIKECVFYNEQQCDRFSVRPGITGLAQINGRNSITQDKILEYDIQYTPKVTFWGDIKIVFKTFFVVFRRKGIDSNAGIKTDHVCCYYNDLLLGRGKITRDEYDMRVAFSRTLRVGDTMPSIDEQRQSESAVLLQKKIKKLESHSGLESQVG